MDLSSINLDLNIFWTWFLIFTRLTGLFQSLPGIGGEAVPAQFRIFPTIMIAVACALTGVHAHEPATLAEGGLMIITEFLLGYVLGLVVDIILAAPLVAGQVSSGAIGLGQANMIDPSLGVSVSILSRIQNVIASMIFLLINGHHLAIKFACGVAGDIGLGMFRPDMSTAMILVQRFTEAFELAVLIAAPVLVTLLVTQFVLGLLTKFVPQVNVFIISMPLTIGLGLFIVVYCFDGLTRFSLAQFNKLPETYGAIFADMEQP